jgi:transposase-like protein
LANRSDDAETTAPEPHAGFQSEGGAGRHRGREDARRAGSRSELAQAFDVHPNQITAWKAQLLEGAAGVFGTEGKADPAPPAVDVKELHAKIGELTLTNDFLEHFPHNR